MKRKKNCVLRASLQYTLFHIPDKNIYNNNNNKNGADYKALSTKVSKTCSRSFMYSLIFALKISLISNQTLLNLTIFT